MSRSTCPRATPAEEAGSAPVAVDRAELTDAVVAIVAGLTGYPSELLDLDLDLEADLGVDTVKQAEVFAAVRAEFGVAREDTLKLRDFPTLNHVIGWVASKIAAVPEPVAAVPEPVAAVPEPVVSPPAEPAVSTQPGRTVADAVVAIVAGLTGYPSELLDLDLDLEADLGVDTVKQAEVFAAVRAEFGVAREDTLKLRDFPTLNHVIGWVASKVAAAARAGCGRPEPVWPRRRADRRSSRRQPSRR